MWDSFYIIFGLIFTSAIVYLVGLIVFSIISMGNKTLPERKVTINTLRVPSPQLTHCPNCGNPIGNGNFCSICGTSRNHKEHLQLTTKGYMSARKFEKVLNEWLAENPYVTDVKLNLESNAFIFSPIVTHRIFVKNAVIEYRVDNKPQNHQYGMAFAYNCRVFGSIGYSYKKHIAKWNKHNADCTIVSTHGTGRVQHWSNQGDIHAEYFSFILFKKPVMC